MAWSHCFQLGSLSKDSLAKMSRNYWYGLGTMSSKCIDKAPPEASASFWEIVWVALISSSQAPISLFSHLCPNHLSLGMQTQVGAWFWCVLVEILGPLPHALVDGDGLSAASISYQPICGLADLSPLWFSACMMPGISSVISPMHQSILWLCSMSQYALG